MLVIVCIVTSWVGVWFWIRSRFVRFTIVSEFCDFGLHWFPLASLGFCWFWDFRGFSVVGWFCDLPGLIACE